MVPGQIVDSAFVVNAARRALRDSGDVLMLHVVKLEVGEDWDLITLQSVGPQVVVGGGGLVWVDRWNGCAIVLRFIE